MDKNAKNFTGQIPETGDTFSVATQAITNGIEGIDTELGNIKTNYVKQLEITTTGETNKILKTHSKR